MILLSIVLGLLTGSMLGLLGGGGSIIAVPIMVYVLGLETKTAIGTSLLIVGVASLLAAISHYRRHYVLVRTAALFGGTGAVGSYLGALAGKHIPDCVQLFLFSGAMALIGLLMLMHRVSPKDSETSKGSKLPNVLAAGCGAGFLTGLLGVGGGFIIVPALTFMAGLPIRKAVGTSLIVIGINSLVGAATYDGLVQWGNGVTPFLIATVAAAPVAGHFAHYIRQDQLKTGFAITLLVLSAFMLSKQILGF